MFTLKYLSNMSEFSCISIPVVKRLYINDKENEIKWDQFVASCPEATFFHLSGWQKIMVNTLSHSAYFLYAEIDGMIQAVLPMAEVKSWLFGHSLVSLPFAVYGGIASSNPIATQALIFEAQKLANKLDVDYIEWRNLTKSFKDSPYQDLYVTFRKPIAVEVSENMNAIPRKQRAMIRKGIKQGLSSRIDQSADNFFELYADNMHRHGTPALSKHYFNALKFEFGNHCEILTVYTPQGQALSSVMSFYFRNEVLPFYAGDIPVARDLAANDFKYWELMRRACERNIKIFDYGRSKIGTGSYEFKKNWGFTPEPLFYEFTLLKSSDIPRNNPSNKKFKYLIAGWKKLPINVANYLGPLIVRNLG